MYITLEPCSMCAGALINSRIQKVYINNIDQENGNGDLHVMANGEDTLIDTGVYSMQYKYNGKLAYLKNYDYTANKGDLYYYDGNESKEIDTGITAIFMY